MMQSVRSSIRRRRQQGSILLHLLVLLAGAAAGATTPNGVDTGAVGTNNIPTRSSPPTVAPRPREPLVLMPVQARSTPSSSSVSPTNAGNRLVQRGAGSTNRPILLLTNTTFVPTLPADKIVDSQVGLVRRGFSPGSIDGLMGNQTREAVRAFQQLEGLPTTGQLDATTMVRLTPDPPLYTNYIVAADDLERLLPLSKTWLGKSQQARLDYETILEMVAERTMSHPNLIRRLNPGVDWTNVTAGAELKVLAVQYPESAGKASSIRIRLADRTLQVFGANSNLIAHFPCSIAQRVEKRPVGEELHVASVAPNPNYTFDPAVFPESEEARELGRKLILQPGPNNPVGAVWIGLDKPGYGIHGTPKPEEVGRTESHGCFRLANWNVRYLLQLVTVGTPVEVVQ